MPWPASLAGKGMRFLSIIWQRLIGLLISYGYRPGNAVLYILVIWLARRKVRDEVKAWPQ